MSDAPRLAPAAAAVPPRTSSPYAPPPPPASSPPAAGVAASPRQPAPSRAFAPFAATFPMYMPARTHVQLQTAPATVRRGLAPVGSSARPSAAARQDVPSLPSAVARPSAAARQDVPSLPSAVARMRMASQSSSAVAPHRVASQSSPVAPQRVSSLPSAVAPHRLASQSSPVVPQRVSSLPSAVAPHRLASHSSAVAPQPMASQPPAAAQQRVSSRTMTVAQQHMSSQPSVLAQQRVSFQPSAVAQQHMSSQLLALAQQRMSSPPSAVAPQRMSSLPSPVSQQQMSSLPLAVAQQPKSFPPSAVAQQRMSSQPSAVAQQPVSSQPSAVAVQPAQHGVQLAQNAKQFCRSRIVPRAREPTLIHYYQRLHNTVEEATRFSLNLRFPSDGMPPDPTQIARVVAHELQGVLGSEVNSLVAKHASDKSYVQAFRSNVAGHFVEYGVSGTHLSYISDALMATPESSLSSTPPPTPPQLMHSHPVVERVRVRVFEAEITHLPLAFVEQLVKTRRAMRRFKSRIELHVRIILALEGKGRKVSDAQLDRLKLQLEKADQQAENERKRRMAAEAAKLEKERRAKEAAKQSERNGLKEKEMKKRRRQENAQASFMKRFVKPKIEERQRDDAQHVRYVPRERSGHYAQEVADDPDVMSVDWWLLSELQFMSISALDQLLKEGASDLKSHLVDCAMRRKEAEKTINSVLQDYRVRRRAPCDDRYPRFARKRAEVRGRGKQGVIKLLQFDENYRPAYYGTFRKSRVVTGRRPFRKDSELDYDHDSDAEWEEEEGEDIQDVEDDKELASEEAELRKLYGSDDEDDDDFLDDDEAGDDDDDDDEGDDGSGQNGDTEKKDKKGEIIDLTKNTQKDSQKARDIARLKRRKALMGSVLVEGVSFTGASKLDAYPVSTFTNSKPIQMFNPFVFSASDIVAEHLKTKVPSTRAARASNIDEQAKLDLAVALVNDGSNRDRIVLQFCESRRTRGLNVPAKSEVVRAISEMASREKRDGDTRAVWHLNDAKLERMVQQMGIQRRPIGTAGPITTPLSMMK